MTIKITVALPNGREVEFEADTEDEVENKIDAYLAEEFPEIH